MTTTTRRAIEPVDSTPRIVSGGGPEDVLTVRHLRVAGSQEEIGRALAAAAEAAHGGAAMPRPAVDPRIERVRRRWFAANHPTHLRRMRGIAEHFGLDPDDTNLTWDWLGTYDVPAGCSVAFYPGTGTKDGHGVLARNFDFPTATYTQLMGLAPLPGERPLAADPWIVELHPDDGYASVTVGIMDLMGAMDGVNEAGLAVALLADNETPDPEPSGEPQVGLAEQQVVRYLLDRCATVEEAEEALLAAKHYYFFTPCHFVVADRSGAAFVWEHSPRRNRELVVRTDPRTDGRLVCTNHLLHRWPDPARLPLDDGPHALIVHSSSPDLVASGFRRSLRRCRTVANVLVRPRASLAREQSGLGTAALTYSRWRTLQAALSTGAVVERREIREQFAAVSFRAPVAEARTFWHAQYDVEGAAMDVSFFLRDVDGESSYGEAIRVELGRSA